MVYQSQWKHLLVKYNNMHKALNILQAIGQLLAGIAIITIVGWLVGLLLTGVVSYFN